MNVAPFCVYAVVAGFGFLGAMRQRRRLSLMRWYLAFVALAALLGLALLPFRPLPIYRIAYWIVELAHNALVCLLALEVITQMLPQRVAQIWGAFLLTILGVALAKELPLMTLAGAMNLSASADFVAGLLLVSLAFFDLEWSREHAVAAFGVALVLLGDALPMVKWIQGTVLTLALQVGDLPGVAVLAGAAWWPASGASARKSMQSEGRQKAMARTA
jgi:hypothetical protein